MNHDDTKKPNIHEISDASTSAIGTPCHETISEIAASAEREDRLGKFTRYRSDFFSEKVDSYLRKDSFRIIGLNGKLFILANDVVRALATEVEDAWPVGGMLGHDMCVMERLRFVKIDRALRLLESITDCSMSKLWSVIDLLTDLKNEVEHCRNARSFEEWVNPIS